MKNSLSAATSSPRFLGDRRNLVGRVLRASFSLLFSFRRVCVMVDGVTCSHKIL